MVAHGTGGSRHGAHGATSLRHAPGTPVRCHNQCRWRIFAARFRWLVDYLIFIEYAFRRFFGKSPQFRFSGLVFNRSGATDEEVIWYVVFGRSFCSDR